MGWKLSNQWKGGTTSWVKLGPAFKFVDDDDTSAFWKLVKVHMIFDVKMDLTQKARLVANSHETEVPTESTYSNVFTPDSV
jgi:hypothetical protein